MYRNRQAKGPGDIHTLYDMVSVVLDGTNLRTRTERSPSVIAPRHSQEARLFIVQSLCRGAEIFPLCRGIRTHNTNDKYDCVGSTQNIMDEELCSSHL
jgi:hypothetical protein